MYVPTVTPGPSFNIYYQLLRPLLTFATSAALYLTVTEEYQDWMSTSLRSQQDTFDFVIVGGGSTGSVLANRLSENFKVLLLEAGGTGNPFSAMPLLAFILHGGIPEDWKYETVPQKSAGFALRDNKIKWHSGKGLGGSSLIHGMIYIRGGVQGFNSIADKMEDPVWNLENVLKYYKMVEDYSGFFDGNGGHGKGGGMSAEKAPLSAFIRNLMGAGKELGLKVKDPNPYGPLTEGIAPVDLYTKEGGRWSAYDGYIKPVMNDRPNLTIRKFSHVHRVLLDNNNVAVGVQYFRHGKTYIAKATKEVILSAGGVQSPKILMLSGIGPKTHLTELGIPVKVDLPVGQRLQDKFGAVVGPFIVDKGNSYVISRDFTLSNQVEWFLARTGSFTSTRAEASFAMISRMGNQTKAKIPDLHTYVLSLPSDEKIEDPIYINGLNFKPEFVKSYFRPNYGKDTFVQFVNLAKPRGFGTLRLKNSDPFSSPLLDPKYLENAEDLEALLEGIKFAVKLVEETKSFRRIGAHLAPIPIPGCEQHEFKSDDYWICLAKSMTATAFKYCGTAPMGKNESDPNAVVDSRLRVFGTKNLRVIDGSVLEESMVSVNHVTCQMLGELASEFISKEYK